MHCEGGDRVQCHGEGSNCFSLFQSLPMMTSLICFRTVIQHTIHYLSYRTLCGALHSRCQKQSTWLSAMILWHLNFFLRVMCSCAIQRTIFYLWIIGKDSTFIFCNNLQQDIMQWQSPSWSLFLSQYMWHKFPMRVRHWDNSFQNALNRSLWHYNFVCCLFDHHTSIWRHDCALFAHIFIVPWHYWPGTVVICY